MKIHSKTVSFQYKIVLISQILGEKKINNTQSNFIQANSDSFIYLCWYKIIIRLWLYDKTSDMLI